MDLIEKMRNEVSSHQVAYTKFILRMGNSNDCLYCFFEGRDDYRYYGIRIRNITQRSFESIECGGKENVLKVKKLIDSHKEYKSLDFSYFIDYDYGVNIISDKNVYCLPSYSIENLYATEHVLSDILEHECNMDKYINATDFKKSMEVFQNLQKKFHEKTLALNSYLFCQNNVRQLDDKQTHLNVDNTLQKHLKSIVDDDLEKINIPDDFNNLNHLNNFFSAAPKVEPEEFEKAISFFSNKNLSQVFRGKFELKFFISFLTKLKSEINRSNSSYFSRRYKCSLHFNYNSALTIFSAYAETPSCLESYLLTKRLNPN